MVPLLGDAVALVQTEMSLTTSEIDVRVTEDIADVMVDPIQIQQVVINIVRNAIEAMSRQQDRQISIRADASANSLVRVTIEDNGPGIDKDVSEQLFRPLASSKTTGMGLGLSICRTIVEAHGGTIEAMPVGERGTRFAFTLEGVEKDA